MDFILHFWRKCCALEGVGRRLPPAFYQTRRLHGSGFWGNKVRKVEYALAREIGRGTKTAVTIGGEKSNHARITVAVCARLGIRCILVLNGGTAQSGDRGHVPASRFAYEMFGAEIRWVAKRENREPTAIAVATELTKAGELTAFPPLGLSMPIGAMGYVQACKEVATQFGQLRIRPDYVFLSSSSSGTLADRKIVSKCCWSAMILSRQF